MNQIGDFIQAVILAAGKGTRLQPLTDELPKVMMPVGTRPFLRHVIDNVKAVGIEDIIVVVGHKKERIMDYFGDSVKYVVQSEQKGTAHAIKQAEKLIDSEKFLVTMGDNLITKDDIKRLSAMKNAVAVYPISNPSEYGVVESRDGKVVGIAEKPQSPKSNTINAGSYVFEKDIFKEIDKTPLSKRGEYEITDTIKMMLKKGKTFSICRLTEWFDFGKPWDILNINERVLNNLNRTMIEGTVEQGVTIKGHIYVGEGSVVMSGAYIEGPVVIGKNCKIGPNCYIRGKTSIGDNCHVGNGVELKNCILMNSSKVPHLSYLGDSIIGENTNIGAGTKVANLKLNDQSVQMTVKGKKEDTGRRKMGAIIGHNVKIGINVTINPGKIIPSDSFVMPNTVI